MNAFQKQCIRAVEYHLKEEGGFESAGEKEIYFKKTVKGKSGRTIELYIYNDEAGYKVVEIDDWRIMERPDFDSDTALIMAFVEGVKREVNNIDDNVTRAKANMIWPKPRVMGERSKNILRIGVGVVLWSGVVAYLTYRFDGLLMFRLTRMTYRSVTELFLGYAAYMQISAWMNGFYKQDGDGIAGMGLFFWAPGIYLVVHGYLYFGIEGLLVHMVAALFILLTASIGLFGGKVRTEKTE